MNQAKQKTQRQGNIALWIKVGLAGFIGSSLRYSLSILLGLGLLASFDRFLQQAAMLIAVNLLGCFYLGFLEAKLAYKANKTQRLAIHGQGFAGALTTFSGLATLAILFEQAQNWILFFVFLAMQFILGACLFWLGKRFGLKAHSSRVK